MSSFWNIERATYWQVALELKKRIPELEKVSAEDIEGRLYGSHLSFIKQSYTPAKWYVRITLPFAMLLVIVLFITLPLKYIFTGKWGYNSNRLYNYFKSLNFS